MLKNLLLCLKSITVGRLLRWVGEEMGIRRGGWGRDGVFRDREVCG